jgi:hypothetical protein
MCCVLSDYSKFTTDTAHIAGKLQATKYNAYYNKVNDKAATKFVLSSLTKELRENLHMHLEPEDTFHVLWQELFKAVCSTSIDCYDDLKTKLKNRKATDYTGQNIGDLSMDYNKDAIELTSAGQYDHNLTLHISQNCCLC